MGSSALRCRYELSEGVAERFHWVAWDGEVVLYDGLTGDTHRLASPSALVLDALSNRIPKSVEDLIAELSVMRFGGLVSEYPLLSSIDALCDIGLLRSIPFEVIESLPR